MKLTKRELSRIINLIAQEAYAMQEYLEKNKDKEPNSNDVRLKKLIDEYVETFNKVALLYKECKDQD